MLSSLLVVIALQQPVTYEHRLDTLRNIIPDLSAKLGTKLLVKGDVQWETIFIRAKDVSREDLLKNIATAAQGVWTTDSEGNQVLIRDPDFNRKFESEVTARRQKAINEMLTMIDKGEYPAMPGEKPEKFTPSNAQKVFATLIRSIGVSKVAALPSGTRTVYSSSPTSMQKPLTFNPTWIPLLLKESQMNNGGYSDETITEDQQKFINSLPESSRKKLDEIRQLQRSPRIFTHNDVAKVNFIVSSDPSSMYFGLNLYTSNGDLAGQFGESVEAYDYPEEISEEEEAKSPMLEIDLNKHKALRLFLNTFGNGLTIEEIEKARLELKKHMMDPIKGDPILEVTADYFDAYAKKVPGNLVLNVGRNDLSYYSNDVSVSIFQNIFGLKSVKEGEWQVTKLNYKSTPVNREMLQELIKRFDNKEGADIEDQAWVLNNINELPTTYLYKRVFQTPDVYSSGAEAMCIKLYALMSDSQREAAKRNGVTYGSLSKAAKDLISNQVYVNEQLFSSYSENADNLFPKSFEHFLDLQLEDLKRTKAYLDDPTEALPNGVPENMLIRIAVNEEPGYAPLAGYRHDFYYTPGTIAQSLVYMEEASNTMFNEFKEVKQKTYKFSFTVNQNIKASYEVNCMLSSPANGKSVSKQDLLKKFAKEYEQVKTVADQMKSFWGSGFGGGGGNESP